MMRTLIASLVLASATTMFAAPQAAPQDPNTPATKQTKKHKKAKHSKVKKDKATQG